MVEKIKWIALWVEAGKIRSLRFESYQMRGVARIDFSLALIERGERLPEHILLAPEDESQETLQLPVLERPAYGNPR